MNEAAEFRMPAIVAWLFFIPGAIFIVASIVILQVTGITVLGAVFLAIWLWLLGGFTREFWIRDLPPTEHTERWDDLAASDLDRDRDL